MGKSTGKFPYSYYKIEQGQAGPGDYHTDKHEIKGIVKWSKSRRGHKHEKETPGPGHYDHETKLGRGTRFDKGVEKFPYSYYAKEQG